MPFLGHDGPWWAWFAGSSAVLILSDVATALTPSHWRELEARHRR